MLGAPPIRPGADTCHRGALVLSPSTMKKGCPVGEPSTPAPSRWRREGIPALCRRPWPFERGQKWPLQTDVGANNFARLGNYLQWRPALEIELSRFKKDGHHCRQVLRADCSLYIGRPGSYRPARFFFKLIAMYLIVSGLAFCLIAAAYAELRPLKPSAGTFISKNLRE